MRVQVVRVDFIELPASTCTGAKQVTQFVVHTGQHTPRGGRSGASLGSVASGLDLATMVLKLR